MNDQKENPIIHLTVSSNKFNTFKRIFDPFFYLLDEFSFYFTKDHITLKNLTDDHIALVHVKFTKDFFNQYTFSNENNSFIRKIESSYFKLIFHTTAILDKTIKEFTMTFFNEKVIINIPSKLFYRQHTLPCYRLPENEILNFEPSQLTLSNSCQINPKIFWHVARVIKLTDNLYIIPAENDKLLITQENEQDKTITTQFTVPTFNLTVKNETKAIGKYNSKWLYLFARVAKVLPNNIQNVTISWQEDAPLRIVYTLENATIACVAAPLLQDDVP